MILTKTNNLFNSLGGIFTVPADSVGLYFMSELSLTVWDESAVYLTRVFYDGNKLQLVFSTDAGILCSLDSTDPVGYYHRMVKHSAGFVSGTCKIVSVPQIQNTVCKIMVTPLFVSTIIAGPATQTTTINGATTPLDSLVLAAGDMTNITYVSGVAAVSAVTETSIESSGGVDGRIESINGVKTSGNVTITLTDDTMTVSGASPCAFISSTETTTCTPYDYEQKQLAPEYHAGMEYPLDLIFPAGISSFDPEIIKTTMFNTDYENAGEGLVWNEFSDLHDNNELPM